MSILLPPGGIGRLAYDVGHFPFRRLTELALWTDCYPEGLASDALERIPGPNAVVSAAPPGHHLRLQGTPWPAVR